MNENVSVLHWKIARWKQDRTGHSAQFSEGCDWVCAQFPEAVNGFVLLTARVQLYLGFDGHALLEADELIKNKSKTFFLGVVFWTESVQFCLKMYFRKKKNCTKRKKRGTQRKKICVPFWLVTIRKKNTARSFSPIQMDLCCNFRVCYLISNFISPTGETECKTESLKGAFDENVWPEHTCCKQD